MQPNTHLQIDRRLCGSPHSLGPGQARATLRAVPEMIVDARGLVHGGFVFGLADHAAMLAINDPNVVLGSSDMRFLRPVLAGDTLAAEARVESVDRRKRVVHVVVRRGEETVCEGRLTCFVLPRHVLDRD